MTTVSRVYIVNGQRTQITEEGDDAAKLIHLLDQWAAHIGGTPEPFGDAAPAPAAAAPASAEAPKRTRRTKAEIEADAAREAAAAAPPSLPPGMGAPAGPITQAFAPAAVELSGTPMMPPAPPEAVSLAPPPFAPPMMPPMAPPPIVETPEDIARAEAKGAVADLLGLVPANWADSVRGQITGMLAPLGGNIDAMSEAQARSALDAVLKYRETCVAALSK